jgi:hypothetical protein
MQRAGAPHLRVEGVVVALGYRARLLLVTRLKVYVWLSRADWSMAAEMVSHASACGAWKARVSSSSWVSLVSDVCVVADSLRRRVSLYVSPSYRVSKVLSVVLSEVLGEALGPPHAC